MPIDYGVYNALRSRPSYEQKARAAQMNMGYMSELNRMTSMQNKERLQAEEAIQARLSQFSETDGLERDKQGLLSLMKKEEAKIIRGIRDAGGDSKRYLNSGGLSDLRKYYTNVKSSEQLQKTINNKKIHADYIEASNKGMLAIPTVMYFDQDGNVTDADDPNGKKETVSVGRQIELYEDNQIEQINWQGAQKPVHIKPGEFQNIINPRDRLKPGPVSVEELQGFLIGMRAHPLLANIQAEKSRIGDTEFTQYQYGYDRQAAQREQQQGSSLLKMIQKISRDKQERINYRKKVVEGRIAEGMKGQSEYFYKPGAAQAGEQKAEIIDLSALKKGEKYVRTTMTPYPMNFAANKMETRLLKDIFKYVEEGDQKKILFGDFQKQNLQYYIRQNSGELGKLDFSDAKSLSFLDILDKPEFLQIQERTYIGGADPATQDQEGVKRGYYKVRVGIPDHLLQELNLATNWLVGEDIIDEAQTNIFGTGDDDYDERGKEEYQMDLFLAIPDLDMIEGFLAEDFKVPKTMKEGYMENMMLSNPNAAYMMNLMGNKSMQDMDPAWIEMMLDSGGVYTTDEEYNQSEMLNE